VTSNRVKPRARDPSATKLLEPCERTVNVPASSPTRDRHRPPSVTPTDRIPIDVRVRRARASATGSTGETLGNEVAFETAWDFRSPRGGAIPNSAGGSNHTIDTKCLARVGLTTKSGHWSPHGAFTYREHRAPVFRPALAPAARRQSTASFRDVRRGRHSTPVTD